MKRFRRLILVFFFAVTSFAQADTSVLQSERAIPLAHEADVVVVGGTTGAVSAAIAAAENGASVFLAAPRPYLGEDVCGTLRLWLQPDEQPQSALEKKLFVTPDLESVWVNRLPITYETDQPSDSAHADSKPPSKLADKRSGSAAHESVQFSKDVTIIAKLEGNKRVKRLHLLAYQRDGEFEVGEMGAICVVRSIERRFFSIGIGEKRRPLQNGELRHTPQEKDASWMGSLHSNLSPMQFNPPIFAARSMIFLKRSKTES